MRRSQGEGGSQRERGSQGDGSQGDGRKPERWEEAKS